MPEPAPKTANGDASAASNASDPNQRLDGLLKAAKADALPPVHLWDPPYCGDIGMEIRCDGTWFYQGTPIGRPAMVRLFSRILRKDEDGKHYLVTPVEKVLVQVEAAPFLAVRVDQRETPKGPELIFTTNLDDVVVADAEHPIRVAVDRTSHTPEPYVTVRAKLEALITRSCFFDLVALATEYEGPEGPSLRVRSAGVEFPLGFLTANAGETP